MPEAEKQIDTAGRIPSNLTMVCHFFCSRLTPEHWHRCNLEIIEENNKQSILPSRMNSKQSRLTPEHVFRTVWKMLTN